MKTLFAALFLFVSINVQAQNDAYTFECESQDHKTLAFSIYKNTNRIHFHNKEAFGGGQFKENTSLPLKKLKYNALEFKYNWYFTGTGYVQFLTAPYYSFEPKDFASTVISYDDGDGAGLDLTVFTCRRTK